MDKTRLINFFIDHRNANQYLEVSSHENEANFAHIRCTSKATTFPISSDAFFQGNTKKFDLIFIDGIHTEEQAMQDIRNAFASLAENGLIVLHDCMPPDAWHQRSREEYKKGENWTGTVWKAALRTFNETAYKCTLIDMDWGCGVIDTAHVQVPRCRALPENLDYEHHYPWLLEYKKSVAEYLREWVAVFYHLACMGNWQDVFTEQMTLLRQNGFTQINLTVLGREEDVSWSVHTCDELHMTVNVLFRDPDLTFFERPAMYAIEEYARKNEGYILYLHSKGVSNPGDSTKAKWRRLMMRELVQNWEGCMLQLQWYDAIGVNWRDQPPTSHFCGNFWYASTRHLRKLTEFRHYYDHPRYRIWDAINSKRLGCEFWISSGKQPPKVLSLFCRNVDFCNHGYWNDK